MASALSTSVNSSDSDSNSDADIYENADIQGYLFEPDRESESLSDHEHEVQETTSESDGDVEDRRQGNTDWCLCTQCQITTLSRIKEHKCCREFTGIAQDVQKTGVVCITVKPSFGVLCLNTDVLTNVLICLNNVRRDNWPIRPPNNRSLRWAAYRQYTWWIYGHLGRRVRRVIPSCVVHKIRSVFPKSDEEQYKPYASDSEDND